MFFYALMLPWAASQRGRLLTAGKNGAACLRAPFQRGWNKLEPTFCLCNMPVTHAPISRMRTAGDKRAGWFSADRFERRAGRCILTTEEWDIGHRENMHVKQKHMCAVIYYFGGLSRDECKNKRMEVPHHPNNRLQLYRTIRRHTSPGLGCKHEHFSELWSKINSKSPCQVFKLPCNLNNVCLSDGPCEFLHLSTHRILKELSKDGNYNKFRPVVSNCGNAEHRKAEANKQPSDMRYKCI